MIDMVMLHNLPDDICEYLTIKYDRPAADILCESIESAMYALLPKRTSEL